MPSGQTHDRITLWSLPIVAGATFATTHSSQSTLIVAGSFLFSGLMFGPDLDIHSRQFQRWGWLRWIWQPYQKVLRHRSLWSHGFIVGTTLRVLYLMLWIGLVCGAVFLGWQCFQGMSSEPGMPIQFRAVVAEANWTRLQLWGIDQIAQGQTMLLRHQTDAIALFLGLEVGAMSHSLSDWVGSAWKSFQTNTANRKSRGSKAKR